MKSEWRHEGKKRVKIEGKEGKQERRKDKRKRKWESKEEEREKRG